MITAVEFNYFHAPGKCPSESERTHHCFRARTAGRSFSYFLVGATPWCANSRSARSLAPTCSPMASRRMRSWQDWQILPFGTAIGLPQTMHFLVGSDIAGSVSQINNLPIDQLMILICL